MKNFLTSISVGDYSAREIKKAFAKIPIAKLLKNFDCLIACQELDNQDVRSLARELALRVNSRELSKKIEYLIDCQRSEYPAVRSLSRELALIVMRSWTPKKMNERVPYLLGCADSINVNVRNLSEEIIVKAKGARIVPSKVEEIIKLSKRYLKKPL